MKLASGRSMMEPTNTVQLATVRSGRSSTTYPTNFLVKIGKREENKLTQALLKLRIRLLGF
jgi:uncharacterized protein Veg